MSVPVYSITTINPREYKGYATYLNIAESYKFNSLGKNGEFELRVLIFQPCDTVDPDLYNLGFGVWNQSRREVIDTMQTKNDDAAKIMGTVAMITLKFLEQNPSAKLYAEGSTSSRTRLYQREIVKFRSALPSNLCILGLSSAGMPRFEELRMGVNYSAFILLRK